MARVFDICLFLVIGVCYVLSNENMIIYNEKGAMPHHIKMIR